MTQSPRAAASRAAKLTKPVGAGAGQPDVLGAMLANELAKLAKDVDSASKRRDVADKLSAVDLSHFSHPKNVRWEAEDVLSARRPGASFDDSDMRSGGGGAGGGGKRGFATIRRSESFHASVTQNTLQPGTRGYRRKLAEAVRAGRRYGVPGWGWHNWNEFQCGPARLAVSDRPRLA